MGDMRELLLKAGLVSEEQAKKAAEEEAQRSARPQGGGARKKGGSGQERSGGGHDRRPPRGERGAAPPRPEPNAALSPKDAKRLLELAQKGRIEGKTRGQRRWYYVSKKGSVPYLELTDELVKELEQGEVAIAETDRGEAWLVTRACAKEIAQLDPSWLR